MSFTTPLSGLDFAVIAVYFAVTLSAGLFMGKFVKSGKDFFSGGNKVPWWMGAISSYMAMISSFVFIAHGGIAYEDGVVALVVFWSCAFAVLAGTWIFALLVAVGAVYVQALSCALSLESLRALWRSRYQRSSGSLRRCCRLHCASLAILREGCSEHRRRNGIPSPSCLRNWRRNEL